MHITSQAREQELAQFIAWTRENPKDWRRLCNPDIYEITPEYIYELIEKLCKEKFFTIVYIIIHMNWTLKEVELAISQTIKECLAGIESTALIDKFKVNLKQIIENPTDVY